ncbi:aminofutalosine synthase MqnE [Helicobacter sp. MIT 01-3238]|uniref:aminofutalosine synthase MqnE n=1 Tax=Helicobacter sp. MIT 01-3238 TaxID=398627 RepID=UPI000E1F0A4B|nr:aminofutalosine synthase MqnE [Helicobacter sp. MIT 01-3238]RDU53611.1 aminofutalosine synthase MqnE [Helicobacter sp. MIT 01-3238]
MSATNTTNTANISTTSANPLTILEQVLAGKECSASELVRLYECDIFTLGEAANSIRKQKYANKVFFNMNRHINPTNICADVCKFCAFSASRRNPNPYQMTIEEVVAQTVASQSRGAKEVHIVSAHSPHYAYEWYMQCFSEVKKAAPKIHLKAMTAAEVDFLSRRFGKDYRAVLEDMAKAGVDSMPGGGAEIFDEKIRKKLCSGKVSSTRWLEIHSYWHSLGKMSNATMLFGHIEERIHRIDHILRLRDTQCDTQIVESKKGGFNAFIPLLYQRENNYLNLPQPLSGQEILKTLSIARIILHNIPHIKAYWATLGANLALVAQEFGADDMDGTIENESIQSAAGAKSKKGISKEMMIAQIKDAGFVPVERDSLYNELQSY